ncbi:hypothetical protein [Rhabdaerophilum sp.]|uniref:hypothetical protein n=1 Tax=Rhabdaerophilum sp. TaxID=2717341 RepID=UPI0038D406CB
MIADDLGQLIEFDAGTAARMAHMALEDVFKCTAPFVAANPFDQPFDRMNCPHWRRTPLISCEVAD